jgi:phosphatidylinositol-bisphosphatase
MRYDALRYKSIELPVKVNRLSHALIFSSFTVKTVVSKPWLTVSPTYGMLIPGEQPFTISITISIGKDIAQALNSGREVLEDILVLRLENGRDYFLTVQSDYARSCFGMSLDDLVTFFEPVRTVPLDPLEKVKKTEENKHVKGAKALCVPNELWLILDAIYEKGLATPNLFIEPGVAEELKEIRECLDMGKAFG